MARGRKVEFPFDAHPHKLSAMYLQHIESTIDLIVPSAIFNVFYLLKLNLYLLYTEESKCTRN